ncbi:Hypothetical predicted protein [Octopus vulgaris]|uniref:Uncharacterized protein n=1 Tax=Octopus vulgaris TaxID=6645 RepID=A0AA36BDJ9_OCTVU|nr:Hypothetical predicted protein [Octopus vulgaris]
MSRYPSWSQKLKIISGDAESLRNECGLMEERSNCSREYLCVSGENIEIGEQINDEDQKRFYKEIITSHTKD